MDNSVQVFDLPPPGQETSQPIFPAPEDQPTQNKMSPEQTQMTSTLAAFAHQMNAQSDETMDAVKARTETEINLGHEDQVRAQIGEQYRQQQIDSLQQLQINALKTNPDDYSLRDALNAEADAHTAPANNSALEENGVAAMQATGVDPETSALGAYLGGRRADQAQFAAKAAVFNAQMDKLRTEAEDEGIVGKTRDFLLGLTGLGDFELDTHLIKGQGTLFKTPATNVNDQKNFLWSQNPQRFGELVADAIDYQKGVWGPALTYRAMLKMGAANIGTVGQTALSYNFWQYAPVATYVPVLKMAKFASGLARLIGNRVLSTNMVTSGIAAKTLGIPSGMEHVQPIEASIAETIPSVSVPDTLSLARSDVGVVSDVADRLAALQKATDQVKATLNKTPRIETSQLQEMIQKGVKDAELTFRDTPVADIKREIVPPELVSTAKIDRQAGKNYVSIGKSNATRAPQKYMGPETGEVPRDLSGQAFTSEQADHVLGNDTVYLDQFENLPALNEHGELRPAMFDTGEIPASAKPSAAPVKGRVRSRGEMAKGLVIDNDTDVDTLSHWNARGDLYHTDGEFSHTPFKIEPPYRVSAKDIMAEHEAEMADMGLRGKYDALAKEGYTIKAYHGTAADFGEHSLTYKKVGGGVDSSEAIFFSSDPHVASGYALYAGEKKAGLGHFDDYDPSYVQDQNVRPSQLKITNPKTIEMAGGNYSQHVFRTEIRLAKAQGHDGIIFKNVNDSVNGGPKLSDVYAVFDPSQIKSPAENLLNLTTGGKIKAQETGNLGGIRSIPDVTKSPSTGLYSLNFFVGKDQAAGGFLTREGAVAAAERRGFVNPQVHQTLDGTWYVKFSQVMPETGLSTKAVTAEDYPAVYKPAEFVKSLDGLETTLHNEYRKGATLAQTRFLKRVVGPYVKSIKSLNQGQIDTLSSVLRASEGERTWYNLDELFSKYQQIEGRAPSEKEQLAYYSAKELWDLHYHITNDRLFSLAARRGVQTITVTNPAVGLDTGRVNARVVPAEEAKGQPILFAEDGSLNHGLRKDLLPMVEGGHYKMIELSEPQTFQNRKVKYILTHEDSIKYEPLERQQLQYSPGGSREYPTKWFGKQANYIVDDEGHRTWLNPLTHVTGSRAAVEKWVKGMEEARQAYIDPKMSEAEKRIAIDKTPIESYDKFEKLVKEGKVHPDTPFELNFDKEQPAFMKRIGANDTNWSDRDLTGEESYYMTQQRLYYGEKGERLMDPAGVIAHTVDPLKTLQKAVYNAAKTRALGDYSTKVIEDWAKAAKPYVDYNTVRKDATDPELFFHADLLQDGLSPAEQRAIKGLDIGRNAHKRFMNMTDPEDTVKAMYLKNLAMKLETKGRIGNAAAQAIYNRMSTNAISAVKDFVFHMYFGFWNIGRFVLHASQAVGAIAYDPIRGLNAAGMAPLTSLLVHVNRGDAVLDYIARKMGPDLGMAVSDYKDMVRSLRFSGWLDVGGEVAQLDRYADRWGGTLMQKGWDTTKRVGILPFHGAIGLQRLMAYHMAWSEIRDLMPKSDVWSDAFQRAVNNKADAFSGNMTTASSAWWQKGAVGIPTQFMSWQARMMENLLPETFGGSRALSAEQKTKYAIGQMLLWGAGGMPLLGVGVDYLSDLYKQNTGQDMSADTYRKVTKGLVDSMIHEFTGADTDLASRTGFGNAVNKTLEGLLHGDYNPFLSVLGGPVVETGNLVADKLSRVVTYMRAEQIDNISTDEFKFALQETLPFIQAFRYDQKAYWAWKYHQLYDPKTDQPILQKGATESDAITQALGIPNVWETNNQHYMQSQDDLENTINDVAKQLVQIRREELTAIADHDTSKADAMERIVRVLMQPYRDRPLLSQQIARRTSDFMTKGYNETKQEQVINRVYKNTGFVPTEANQ